MARVKARAQRVGCKEGARRVRGGSKANGARRAVGVRRVRGGFTCAAHGRASGRRTTIGHTLAEALAWSELRVRVGV